MHSSITILQMHQLISCHIIQWIPADEIRSRPKSLIQSMYVTGPATHSLRTMEVNEESPMRATSEGQQVRTPTAPAWAGKRAPKKAPQGLHYTESHSILRPSLAPRSITRHPLCPCAPVPLRPVPVTRYYPTFSPDQDTGRIE